MFLLLKLIKPFILPPALIALGMTITLVLIYRKRIRLAKYILFFTLIVYYLLSIEPIAFILTRSLVQGVTASPISLETMADPPEAIVVLAGGAEREDEVYPFPELSGTSWRRLWRGLEVYRQLNGKVPILYSGDSGDPFGPQSGEAVLAREYAIAMGVSAESFLVETSSRTTMESGIAIKQMLDEKFPEHINHRVILVTSSWHVPRAQKVLVREGIEVTSIPADFPTTMRLTLDPLSFVPSVEHFSSSNFVLHEWIGIGAYRILSTVKNTTN